MSCSVSFTLSFCAADALEDCPSIKATSRQSAAPEMHEPSHSHEPPAVVTGRGSAPIFSNASQESMGGNSSDAFASFFQDTPCLWNGNSLKHRLLSEQMNVCQHENARSSVTGQALYNSSESLGAFVHFCQATQDRRAYCSQVVQQGSPSVGFAEQVEQSQPPPATPPISSLVSHASIPDDAAVGLCSTDLESCLRPGLSHSIVSHGSCNLGAAAMAETTRNGYPVTPRRGCARLLASSMSKSASAARLPACKPVERQAMTQGESAGFCESLAGNGFGGCCKASETYVISRPSTFAPVDDTSLHIEGSCMFRRPLEITFHTAASSPRSHPVAHLDIGFTQNPHNEGSCMLRKSLEITFLAAEVAPKSLPVEHLDHAFSESNGKLRGSQEVKEHTAPRSLGSQCPDRDKKQVHSGCFAPDALHTIAAVASHRLESAGSHAELCVQNWSLGVPLQELSKACTGTFMRCLDMDHTGACMHNLGSVAEASAVCSHALEVPCDRAPARVPSSGHHNNSIDRASNRCMERSRLSMTEQVEDALQCHPHQAHTLGLPVDVMALQQTWVGEKEGMEGTMVV
jgi:hypothetical protein